MRFRSSASFGKRQEYKAIAKLLELGYDVYQTLVDDQGIDCIIRLSKDRYIDIQIRARSKECASYDAGRFAAFALQPRKNYYFIFYDERLDIFWIFPSLELVKFTHVNKKGSNIGKHHIMLTGCKKSKVYASSKFQKYINNFDLLKQ